MPAERSLINEQRGGHFEQARTQFTEEELVNLTLAIIATNGWNRLAIGFREVPGTHQPQRSGNK